jgi:FtsH ternary system-associated peptide
MTRYQFVDHLPDLIQPDEYAGDPSGRRVKLRLVITDRGVELLGDAVRPEELERLLLGLDPETIEHMLCG